MGKVNAEVKIKETLRVPRLLPRWALYALFALFATIAGLNVWLWRIEPSARPELIFALVVSLLATLAVAFDQQWFNPGKGVIRWHALGFPTILIKFSELSDIHFEGTLNHVDLVFVTPEQKRSITILNLDELLSRSQSSTFLNTLANSLERENSEAASDVVTLLRAQARHLEDSLSLRTSPLTSYLKPSL